MALYAVSILYLDRDRSLVQKVISLVLKFIIPTDLIPMCHFSGRVYYYYYYLFIYFF